MTEEINDDNPCRRKELITEDSGLQIFENDGSPSLYALYSCDLGEHILSYASTSDLCKLDLINCQFREELMTKTWRKKTYERFGLNTGKDGWRMGTSLLREPVFIYIERRDMHGPCFFRSAEVTANDSLIVVDTDEYGVRYEYDAQVGINLFDARDLTYLGRRRERGGWKTTVAGQDGNRLFISMERDFLRFSRGDICLRRQFTNNNPSGIPLIASETHVIFVINNIIHLLKIVPSDNLVESCQVKELRIGALQRDDEHYQSAIAWGADQSEFVVYNSIRRRRLGDDEWEDEWDDEWDDEWEDDEWEDDYLVSKIFVFSLDAEAHTITQSQAFETDIKLNREIAMGEDFIAGSCEQKKIHVWDRRTPQMTQSSLRDVEDENDSLYRWFCPIKMVCHGHMLVTTSHVGAALCIWNMKTGQLMKRYNHADDEGTVDRSPDGSAYVYVTSLAYSKPLNCHICMSGWINVWAFPTNSEQARIALLAREREEERRRRI